MPAKAGVKGQRRGTRPWTPRLRASSRHLPAVGRPRRSHIDPMLRQARHFSDPSRQCCVVELINDSAEPLFRHLRLAPRQPESLRPVTRYSACPQRRNPALCGDVRFLAALSPRAFAIAPRDGTWAWNSSLVRDAAWLASPDAPSAPNSNVGSMPSTMRSRGRGRRSKMFLRRCGGITRSAHQPPQRGQRGSLKSGESRLI
jgi:hypothetical protein